jgi:serine protease SohB
MIDNPTWRESVIAPMEAGLRRVLPGLGAPIVPVVRLSGTIGRISRLQPGMSLGSVAPLLQRAFDIKAAPAVVLIVNSPGGSPVQSHLIYKRIRALAEENEKTVLVFVEDVCASGGYMIACAGDEIIVDPASIIGSIGVVSAGFGFVEAMRRIGVERRVYTAGESKVILDPFQPEKEKDIEYLKSLQLEIHQVFISMVRERRAGKLTDDATVFSGLFWSGTRGLELGLIDGLGDMRQELKKRYGQKTKLQLVTAARGLLGRRIPGVSPVSLESAASGLASGLVEAAEERALWSRYGL